MPNAPSNYRLLITGAKGQLGRAWRQLALTHSIEFTGIDINELDLAVPNSITPDLVHGFTHLIHCGAWTDVDGAETDEENATVINAESVRVLADACRVKGVTMVQYSTDYVFDGSAATPIEIDHPTSPINAYGRSKLAGEVALINSGAQHLLVRTSWVYAPWGQNFLRTMLRLGSIQSQLRVVNDQRGTPTSAEHLACTTLALLIHNTEGIVHVTDGGECTWFEFARETLAATYPHVEVTPCRSTEFPRPARRPAYSVLDTNRAEALLGSMPGWESNLRDVLSRTPALE